MYYGQQFNSSGVYVAFTQTGTSTSNAPWSYSALQGLTIPVIKVRLKRFLIKRIDGIFIEQILVQLVWRNDCP